MTPEEIARYNKMMYMRQYRKNIKEKQMLVSKENTTEAVARKRLNPVGKLTTIKNNGPQPSIKFLDNPIF